MNDASLARLSLTAMQILAERDKILIPLREFRGDTGWRIHKDGLLEAPDGRTEFDTTNPRGEVTSRHSYYLDRDNVPVEIRQK